MTHPVLEDAMKVAESLRSRAKNTADDRNRAYDRYGWDNTPESVDPTGIAGAETIEALVVWIKKATGQ